VEPSCQAPKDGPESDKKGGYMETVEMLDTELSRVERQCEAQTVDVHPWVSNDNPLSLQHWRLTQRKLRLLCPGRHGGLPKAAQAKKTLSSTHMAALQAGRLARLALKTHECPL
jgi:hypothetical protein